MTVRELINSLKDVDGDVLDYEVWFTFRLQIGRNLKFAGRARLEEVPENVDVDQKIIYLKSATDRTNQ